MIEIPEWKVSVPGSAYVIVGEQGEYSDKMTWVVRAFVGPTAEEDANAFCDVLGTREGAEKFDQRHEGYFNPSDNLGYFVVELPMGLVSGFVPIDAVEDLRIEDVIPDMILHYVCRAVPSFRWYDRGYTRGQGSAAKFWYENLRKPVAVLQEEIDGCATVGDLIDLVRKNEPAQK